MTGPFGCGLGQGYDGSPTARAPPGLFTHELGFLATEEGGDAVAQVLGRHAVGDPVALQLQVVVDAVLDADRDQLFAIFT